MNKINKAVNDAAEKFGYDEELVGVLQRIIPAMSYDKSDEIQEMICNTLLRTKIYIFDHELSEEEYDACERESLGDPPSRAEFVYQDRGEYDKGPLVGGYVSEPVFDQDMELVDRKSFIYSSRIPEGSPLSKVYGTTINLSHLIHELGHGVASEKDEYVKLQDGSIINNLGAYSIKYKVDKENKKVYESESTGLIIEDALNTIQEEEVLCKVLGIDSVKELSQYGYVPSNYQGTISDMMQEYINKFGKERFDSFRILKQKDSINDIENALSSTDAWKKIQDGKISQDRKDAIDKIDKIDFSDWSKERISGFFEEYKDIYFPDNSQFTPIEKLENVFSQIYNFKAIRYNFNLSSKDQMEAYKGILLTMLREGYVPLNQAPEIDKQVKDKKPEENKEHKEETIKTSFIGTLQSSVYPPEDIPINNKVDSDDGTQRVKKQVPVDHEDI